MAEAASDAAAGALTDHLKRTTIAPTPPGGMGVGASVPEIVDVVLAAALPLLTPEDVPHLVALVLRDAADEIALPGSEADGYYGDRNHAGYLEADHAETWLRARADRIASTESTQSNTLENGASR